MPKYSYVITEGFERSKVFIDEVLKKALGQVITSMNLGGGVTSVDGIGNVDSPEQGKVYYDTATDKYYTYDGVSFNEFGGGVTDVDSLPAEGKQGKVYYNTADGKYYIHDGSGYQSLSTAADSRIPIISGTDATHTYWYTVTNEGRERIVYGGSDTDFASPSTHPDAGIEAASRDSQGFYLESGKFYDLGTIASFDTTNELDVVTKVGGLRLYCVADSTSEVKEYMGRFTVDSGSSDTAFNLVCLPSKADDSSIATSVPVIIPDDTPDLESGHTYEFNISASVLAIKDITYTES